MSRVLVSGAGGFVGSHLVRRLQGLGHEVTSLGSETGDIADEKTFRNLPGADVVFHLAARVFIPQAIASPRDTLNTNIFGTINALEFCRKQGAKFIFFSSYVYGSPHYLPVDEIHPIAPATNPYTLSKIICEQIVKYYSDCQNVPGIILRPFNIYGPGQKKEFLIPLIIGQIKSGKILLKDSRPRRDFIYVDDIVEACILALKFSCRFEIFNLGAGASYSVEEIVNLAKSVYGKPCEVRFLNEQRENEILDCYASISKAKNILGWSPRTSLEQGLRLLISSCP